MPFRDLFGSRRSRILIASTFAVLVIAALWLTFSILQPLPPRTVIMATGPEGNAYNEFGKLYREVLEREGIRLQLLPTAGAMENLSLLRDPRSKVEIAFLQSGITNRKESPDLESLGAVFYEPLWFFYRGSAHRGKGIEFLRGKKISIGAEGSGTRALTLKLLALNGIDRNFADLLSLSPQEAAGRLVRGDIDAAFLLTSWDAPLVRQLLAEEGIGLASFPRTDAYLALYPYLNKVVLPEGVVDLARNRPPSDVLLFAPKANLVVRKDLHTALQYLLLDAAVQIHSGPAMFQKAGQFPAAESIDLPLSDEARQFYRSGRPFLQRHLPFWLAVLIGRLLFLIIPVVGIIYPLVQLVPAVYGWQVQRRIFQLFGELRFIEHDLETRTGQDIEGLLSRMGRIEEKANRIHVPLAYANMKYTLWIHITLVRERLERARSSGKTTIE